MENVIILDICETHFHGTLQGSGRWMGQVSWGPPLHCAKLALGNFVCTIKIFKPF